jgi:DNA-binding YbaB/EbfC family protein
MQPDINQLMRSVQKAQQAMEKIQQELAVAQVQGTVGGGAVTITCTGAMEFTAVKIKPEAVDPSDVETLEDLVLMAIKDACQKSKDLLAQKTQNSPLGNMQMPPGLGF